MRQLKKAASLACCAASIAAMCIAAVSASADSVNEFTAAQIYAAKNDTAIPYTVKLLGDSSFDYVTFRLRYDNRLKPVLESDTTPQNDSEDFSGLATVKIETKKNEIAYSLTCSKPQMENPDKNLVKLYFELPANAKQGDIYEIKFVDGESKVYEGGVLQYSTCASGWIQVNDAESGTQITTTAAETTANSEAVTTEADEKQHDTGLKDALGILLLVGIFTAAGFAFVKFRKH